MNETTENTFQVVLLGFPDRSAFDAAAKLAEAFGLDETTSRRFVTTAPVSVRGNVRSEEARQYLRQLLRIGADVQIVNQRTGGAKTYQCPSTSTGEPKSNGQTLPRKAPEAHTPPSGPSQVDKVALKPRHDSAREQVDVFSDAYKVVSSVGLPDHVTRSLPSVKQSKPAKKARKGQRKNEPRFRTTGATNLRRLGLIVAFGVAIILVITLVFGGEAPTTDPADLPPGIPQPPPGFQVRIER